MNLEKIHVETQTDSAKEDAESFALVGVFVGFLIAYFGAEVVLAVRLTPITGERR